MSPRAAVKLHQEFFYLTQSRVGFWCSLPVSGEWNVITLKKKLLEAY